MWFLVNSQQGINADFKVPSLEKAHMNFKSFHVTPTNKHISMMFLRPFLLVYRHMLRSLLQPYRALEE